MKGSTLLAAIVLFSFPLTAGSVPQISQSSEQPRLRFRIAVNQGKWEQLMYDGRRIDNQDVIRSIQALIIDKLVKTGWFEVMEREATAGKGVRDEKDIDAERRRELEQKGREIPGRSVVVAADYIITPELLEFTATSKKGGGVRLGPVDTRKTENTCKVNMALRIASTETTSIIASASGTADKKESGSSLGVSIGGAGVKTEDWNAGLASKAFEDAIGKCIENLVKEFAKFPWQAVVAQVTEKSGQVVINKGLSAGVAVGMTFDVMEVGEPVIDPSTGNQIAPGEETKIGTVKVVRVLPQAAFCEVVTGKASSIQRGYLVRVPSKAN